MNAAESIYLNRHAKRLNKYGIDVIVQPDDYKYNLRFKDSKEIIEPYCSPTEILGIINSIEVVFERILNNDKNNYMDRNDRISINSIK